jgi:hypothetical protein
MLGRVQTKLLQDGNVILAHAFNLGTRRTGVNQLPLAGTVGAGCYQHPSRGFPMAASCRVYREFRDAGLAVSPSPDIRHRGPHQR